MSDNNTITARIQILNEIDAIDRMINQIDTLVSSLERLETTANTAFDVFNRASGIQFPEVPNIPTSNQSESSNTPEPETATEPPNFNWNTNSSIDMFDTSGVQRFRQEMNALDSQMQQIVNNQTRIDSLADNRDIIPDNMVTDINSVNDRIVNLHNSINSIQRTGINDIGADRVNNQVERLREQLNNA